MQEEIVVVESLQKTLCIFWPEMNKIKSKHLGDKIIRTSFHVMTYIRLWCATFYNNREVFVLSLRPETTNLIYLLLPLPQKNAWIVLDIRQITPKFPLFYKIILLYLSKYPMIIKRNLKFINLLATDFFFQILAHLVFKMWVIQKPNKVALWNKRHFEETKMEITQHV